MAPVCQAVIPKAEVGVWVIRIIDNVEAMSEVEALQRIVWPGSETEIVPVHVLRSTVQHGGLLIGAWQDEHLIGFVFGFPGGVHPAPTCQTGKKINNQNLHKIKKKNADIMKPKLEEKNAWENK
jgi:predicted GNAT superfamily acetyltransferase